MVTGFHGQMVKWQKKGFPYCCQVVKERLYECQLWFRLLYWLDFLDTYDSPPSCIQQQFPFAHPLQLITL